MIVSDTEREAETDAAAEFVMVGETERLIVDDAVTAAETLGDTVLLAATDADADAVTLLVGEPDRDLDTVAVPPTLGDTDALAVVDANTDDVGVGEAASPVMRTLPKLILLVPRISLVESNMRAHMMDWPSAATGSVAVIV
jgi:hypothetical protein